MFGFISPAEDAVAAGERPADGVVAFDAAELRLLDEALRSLNERGMEVSASVARRIADVEALGGALSRFPSVLEYQRLGTLTRGPSTISQSISRISGSARLLHTPTRVVVGRGFLVAKVHALSFASLAVSYDPDLVGRFRSTVLSVVFTLLMEDVYLTCLEDGDFPQDKKEALLQDVIDLWDHLRDPGACSHAPALAELWATRDGQAPVFGTMEGACELVRLSLDLRGLWLDFVAHRLGDPEAQQALEEFLFGLTYEEIETVRRHLGEFGICTADADTVRIALGSAPLYVAAVGTDPRGMYEFYAERREAARARRRARLPGPTRTLEELYLAYLLGSES